MTPNLRRPTFSVLHVRARPGHRAQGWLIVGPLQIKVALGRSGIKANKLEGDGATPRGSFRLTRLWWRPDRGPRPRSQLPWRRITQRDGWCEQPEDRRYNRPIRLSAGVAGDLLWRDDRLYDLLIELDHNTRPRVARRGSAVFVHVARPGLQPTAGCVALPAARLRWLVAHIGPRTRVVIG